MAVPMPIAGVAGSGDAATLLDGRPRKGAIKQNGHGSKTAELPVRRKTKDDEPIENNTAL